MYTPDTDVRWHRPSCPARSRAIFLRSRHRLPPRGRCAYDCRLSFRRVPAAQCAEAEIPAACTLVRSSIERRRAPRGLRGPAERAPRRRVIFVAVSPVTGHCRRLGAQKSLDQTNIVGRRNDQAVRFVGSQREPLHGWASYSLRGFPNFSTNRSTPAPVTRIGLQRTASPGERVVTHCVGCVSRLRSTPAPVSGLRSGMAFSATPRATVRQVVLPPLGLLLLWIARRGCYWSCGSCTLPDRFGDQW